MPYPYETATPEQRAIGSWWWCVHHEVHLEPLTEPIKNRVAYIKENKPIEEIGPRLRELRPVLHPERLPERLAKAWAEYAKARAELAKARDGCRDKYAKAQTKYTKAWNECDKAWDECEPELMALHREEYPDTKWNGGSIFND